MGKKSREKGARGERELVAYLKRHGLHARRTAQMQSQDASFMSDVSVEEWPDIWIECKREANARPRPALQQGMREVAETGSRKIPLAVVRGDRQPWMVYGRWSDLFPNGYTFIGEDWFIFHHIHAVEKPSLKVWWKHANAQADEFGPAYPYRVLTLFDVAVNDQCVYLELDALLTRPDWAFDRRPA